MRFFRGDDWDGVDGGGFNLGDGGVGGVFIRVVFNFRRVFDDGVGFSVG